MIRSARVPSICYLAALLLASCEGTMPRREASEAGLAADAGGAGTDDAGGGTGGGAGPGGSGPGAVADGGGALPTGDGRSATDGSGAPSGKKDARASSGRLDGGTGGNGGNAISGTVKGKSFASVGSASWINVTPDPTDPTSRPTQIYISEAALSCGAISVPLWDKVPGVTQLLEVVLASPSVKTFTIGKDADANYLAGATSAYNPTATGGSVTVTAVNPSQNIKGTFDLNVGGGRLQGSFDAPFCATGLEP